MKLALFDLDGTLTDSQEGIIKSIKYALDEAKLPVPDEETLQLFLGPPIIESFQEHCGMTEEEATYYYKVFQRRYSTLGKFENHVYEGVPELLQTLQNKGYTLAVATAKPEVFACQILEHFGLAKYFAVIQGAHNEIGLVHKDNILEEALKKSDALLPKAGVYEYRFMVGDRKYDIEAARIHGCISIAVAYGYGLMEELENSGADYIVSVPIAVSDVICHVEEQI